MLIAIPADPTRRLALAAYRPGPPRVYYSWALSAWTPDRGPDTVHELAPDPAAPCGDVAWLRPPDALAAQPDVVLQLLALDAAGRPIETVDCETLVG